MSNPVIVFVPGAWHTSAAFDAVIDLLKAHDYESIGLHLPSVGGNPVVTDMEPDKALIRSTVTELANAGKDVVVVCHSYGGAPTSSSLEGLSQTEREKLGKKGGVVALAMISAMLLNTGRSILNGARPSGWTSEEGATILANNSAHIFYNDLPAAEAAYWTSRLLPQARASFDATITYAAWKVIPVHYLLCELDNAIPVAFQRKMCEDAQGMGADVRIESVEASHSPFLSQPKNVARWVKRAAGETEVTGMERA